ncbi:MAG: pseudaminic acid synthase [Planctomycetes bacterium RBG_13_63_9]|nr:MAG: pseudaminic acid synthase [Planctomycetes bacterium RBG_13_63_9]
MRIDGHPIGTNSATFIVAELSANHRQDFDHAVRLVEAAKHAGADAVKLQTYRPDTLTIRCDRPEFRIDGGTPWDGRTLWDLYAEAAMPWHWQPKLQQVARRLGLVFFSTAFDPSAVDFLEQMNVPAYKIASFELVDLPLLRRVARTGKPIILSTGLATLAEIQEAVATIRAAGDSPLALLKCTSAYPAPAESMNLRTIPHLAKTFGLPVGLSDHTLEPAVPVAAVALGACIIEKHLTLSRADAAPDSPFSLQPDEFKQMVQAIRATDAALGSVAYGPGGQEACGRCFRRSLFAVQEIHAGEPFTTQNVRCIRPGHGLPPRHLEEILGQTAQQDIAQGTPLAPNHLT